MGGAAIRQVWKETTERNNRKSGSTIFYLALTHVQQGKKRKSTVSLVNKKLCLINPRI